MVSHILFLHQYRCSSFFQVGICYKYCAMFFPFAKGQNNIAKIFFVHRKSAAKLQLFGDEQGTKVYT